MKRKNQILCLLALASATGHAVAQSSDLYSDVQITQAALTGNIDICWNQPVPASYAVVAHKSTSACNGTNYAGQPNTKTIREPYATGDTVCGFPLPSGFVITTDKVSSQCPANPTGTNGWNALYVKLAGQSETVCSNSPVPAGYSQSATFASGQCRTGFARNITRI